MTLRLLFFTQLREMVGQAEVCWELPPGSCVRDLERLLATKMPQSAPLLPSITFAVNNEYVQRDTLLHDGDVVALISPISGG